MTGLRNPWRWSFDRLTADLYIGDVGQGRVEEINVIAFAELAGADFGWDDGEWPPGEDVIALATERVVRNASGHMRWARLVPEQTMPIDLVWREDDDSPVLKTFLEVATPAPAAAP